jgi:hypothetical protein
VNHPRSAFGASPSRGRHQRTGKAGSAVSAWWRPLAGTRKAGSAVSAWWRPLAGTGKAGSAVSAWWRPLAGTRKAGSAVSAWWRPLAVSLFGALLFTAILLAIVLRALKPAPQEWRYAVQLGPVQRELSVPGLLRVATHPLAAALIDGRSLRTEAGRWQLQARADGHFEATCAPCTLRLRALGPAPITLARAHVQARRAGADRFDGTLWLGEGAHALALPWRAQLTAGGAIVDVQMSGTPMAEVVQVFGHDLPEAARARVDGTFGFTLHAVLPDGPLQIHPRLDGLAVSGLGTEQLLDAQVPAACRSGAGDGNEPIGGWLPRAVISAEDQRFYEHAGYDITQMIAAWQQNQSDGATLIGGSTLTQQLAKLVYTGDDRSATRKLRELLYAAEMERTLGKARILQLYLALAPWGQGVCGAERAARVYLHKSASSLGPVESAWLASLLTSPDAQLRRVAAGEPVDAARVEHVIEGMRPMSLARREKALAQLTMWSPPPLPGTRRVGFSPP